MTSSPLVVLSHWSSADNLGDYAIVMSQVRLLRSLPERPDLLILGVEEGVEFPPELAQFSTACSPWSSPGTVGYARWLVDLAAALATLLAPRSNFLPLKFRQLVGSLDSADVLMPKGGGYLYARRGLRGLLFTIRSCWMLLLARRMRLRRVLLGHSIGPAENRTGAFILRAAVRGAEITVRDDASRILVSSWGLACNRMPDLAFGCRRIAPEIGSLRRRIARLKRSETIGVTVRSVGSPIHQNEFERALATAINKLSAVIRESGNEVTISLFPQVIGPTQREDDRPVLARLASLLVAEARVTELSHTDMTDALRSYATVDFLIATRLHSAILASCVSVPFVVIEYIGGKAAGAVGDLGLPEWTRIRQTDGIMTAVQQGWDERLRLRAQIDQAMPRIAGQLEEIANAGIIL